MSSEAKDLRDLAWRIEQVTHDSRCSSIAWEQVRALCDYLTLRAKVMELEHQLGRHQAEMGDGNR
jgi:hypothetical protein